MVNYAIYESGPALKLPGAIIGAIIVAIWLLLMYYYDIL